MKVSEELKKRIRQLEEEQERQQQELKDLDELRDLATMKELEKELSEINTQMIKSSESELLDDIDLSLEDILKDLEQDDDFEAKSESRVKDIDLSLESPLGQANKKNMPNHGYLVCLVFNPNSPSEWSDEAGGGWRGRNMGTRYPTYEKAEETLKELRKKWPDNPMQVIRFQP